MQARIKPAWYLILVVYAVLIGWLLFREYGETRGVNYSLGEIRISATQVSSGPGNIFPASAGSYRSLSLSFRSFLLEIPESGEAVEVLTDGTERIATISSLDRSSRDIAIRLSSGVELRVSESDDTENTYLINVDFSEVADPELAGIRLPWSGREPEIHTSLPILRASPAGTTGGLILFPPSARVGTAAISLRRTDEPGQILLLQEESDEGLINTWFSRHVDLTSAAQARSELARFFDQAYSGWQDERWLADAGTWEYLADSPPESVTAAEMLTESLPRGNYFSTRMRLAAGSERLIDETSALFLGSVSEPFREMAVLSDTLVESLRQRINQGDGSLFVDLDRIVLALDAGLNGSSQLRDPLADLAEAVILAEPENPVDLTAAVNAARFLLRYSGQDNPGIRYLIREQLLPRVCTSDSGYGIRFGERIDTMLSAVSGVLMIESGDEFSGAVGNTLLSSIFAAAGDEARTPAGYRIEEFATPESGTVLEPESLTRILPRPLSSDYRPRALNLGAGEGWIWTAAGDVRFTAGETSSLSFRFPTGGVHHFALFGIRPFTELQMHGIPWNSDPEFQNYSDGWVYDARRRALFVKITHRAEQQAIRIIRRPAAEAAPVETVTTAESGNS